MGKKWNKIFISSAGGILLAAALIRFLIAAGNAPILSLPDPALGIPLRYAVLVAGGLELIVALICLFGKQIEIQLAWLAWLSTDFVVFQVGLLLMHCHPQATCIGSLTDPLHLSRGITGIIVRIIPICLLFASYTALIRLWWGKEGRSLLSPGQAEPVEWVKMSCALCNGHIVFSSANLGQKIPCPHCKATISLMMPKNIKTACPSCGGHIEIPLHGLGQTIACPHCTAYIKLQLPA